MDPLCLFFLGPPRIERDGQVLVIDTRKATALLAFLVLSGERQTRDSLAAFLWPDFDDKRGKAALRRTLSALKSAIGGQALAITRASIGLKSAHVWCDVFQFQQLLQGEPDVTQLESAVALYRDDFLAGFSLRDSIPFDDWQLVQEQNLRRELEIALEKLIRHHITRQAYDQALPLAHRWLALDSLREDVHRYLMQLYAWLGQPNAALRQYRECVRILEEELGVPPLQETTALYEAIRDNRAAVPAPAIELDALPSSPPLQHVVVSLPLIGRMDEQARMQHIYQQIGPDGRLLAIEGESGIGKTRLTDTFLDGLAAHGAVVLSARCYEGENNLAYAAIVQILKDGLHQPQAAAKLANVSPFALAEAGRLLPELLEVLKTPLLPASLEAPGAQNRFYEGVGQVLATLLNGSQPGVFWLDDVHWLDSASLELLLFLMRRWPGRPYLILLCWRIESLPAAHPLYHLIVDLRRAGVMEHLLLSRFTLQEVRKLLMATMPSFSTDLPDKLYRETEGLPYFVVEYLNALLQQNLPDGLETSWDMPHTVRDLLTVRLAQADETERQLLQTAAAIGRPFEFELLRLASGRSDEETVSSLETLVARGLLVEQKTGYDFSHAKLRQLAYAEIGLARRRLLHRRLAEALIQANRQQTQTMAVAAEIANHYRLSGGDAEAAHYFVLAGDQARTLFAHQEGIHYYQSALALGYADAWKLHEACGDMFIRLGKYSAALSSYETAASLAQKKEIGRLEYKLGQVYIRQGAWPQAGAQMKLARQGLIQADDLARLFLDWSFIAFNQREMALAQNYANQGRKMANTPQVQAQGENISGLLARHEGEFQQALAHFEQSLALAKTYKLPDTQIAALNNLALTETAVGQFDEAQEYLSTALALCQTIGDRHREAALHNNLADLFHQVGDEKAAMTELKTAVSIYAEIGGQPGNWQPEIWKLTEW